MADTNPLYPVGTFRVHPKQTMAGGTRYVIEEYVKGFFGTDTVSSYGWINVGGTFVHNVKVDNLYVHPSQAEQTIDAILKSKEAREIAQKKFEDELRRFKLENPPYIYPRPPIQYDPHEFP